MEAVNIKGKLTKHQLNALVGPAIVATSITGIILILALLTFVSCIRADLDRYDQFSVEFKLSWEARREIVGTWLQDEVKIDQLDEAEQVFRQLTGEIGPKRMKLIVTLCGDNPYIEWMPASVVIMVPMIMFMAGLVTLLVTIKRRKFE